MLPIALASPGEKCIVKKITGSDKVRRHLQEMGVVVDAVVTVVSSDSGNLILNVKDSRVAIGTDIAARIMV